MTEGDGQPDPPPDFGPTPPIPPDGTVAVIGASLAGLRTVQGLRDQGFVGSITLVGEELHQPYDRPPLSKQVLAGTWPPERTVLADHHALHELGVEAILGHRAVTLDIERPRVTLDDGRTLEPDRVLIATGAVPRRLPGTDDHPGVTVLRTLDDCNALRSRLLEVGEGARVVVVGAGFIGAEVAATCAGLGCRVTVLEAMPVPLEPAVGQQIGGALGALHERHGVSLHTGVGVRAIHPPAEGAAGDGASGDGASPSGVAGRVELASGESFPADVVVVGIGVTPAVDWLADSGLTIDNGVVCDASLFCASGVLAAGDLARWRWPHHGDHQLTRIEHWEVAAQMGAAAAHSLLAGSAEAPAFDPVPYFWSDQYGLRIQLLGRPLPTDEVEVVDGSLDAEDGKFVALYRHRDRLSAALAVSRPRKLMMMRPLLMEGATWDRALEVAAGL